METKVNYTAVGAFVLVLSGLLIAGVLWLATGGAVHKKYDTYLAMVGESVAGLNLNAPVKYRGVDVGRVQEIELDPANPQQVRLLFAIERGTPIKVDTEAVLKTQGLTGIAYVELDGGSASAAPLRVVPPALYPSIRTRPSLAARLENMLTTLMAKLDTTSDGVNRILSERNVAAFSSTLADLSTLARTLAARKDTIDAGIASAARTFDNSARLSAQLGPVIERIGPVIERIGPVIERVGASADKVGKMGDAATLMSQSAGQTIKSVGADVKRFSSDAVPDLQALIGEMNVLAVSLRRLIEETERNPRGFIFGRQPVPEGPGEAPARRADK